MNYKETAFTLAAQAAGLMRANFTLGMHRDWKENNTPVTATDLAINHLVIKHIRERFPDHSVLGEEDSSLRPESDYVWVCDPLDGTIPFSHGVPTSVFSLALTYKGESILGILADPYMDRTVYAEKGKGAFLNGKPIKVSEETSLRATAINVEVWKRDSSLKELPFALGEHGAKVTTLCSVAYAGMLVACGEFTADIFGGHNAWDIAALKVIVEEAGGKVTDINGKEQRYDQDIRGAVISNGLVHQQVLDLITQERINAERHSSLRLAAVR